MMVRLVSERRPVERSGEDEPVIGVEQWAEIRRLYFIKKHSKGAICRVAGAHRATITRAKEKSIGLLGPGYRHGEARSSAPGYFVTDL
jgi:hypothetical protein